MADDPQTTPTETPQTTPPLANDPAARTETGEIKDVQTTDQQSTKPPEKSGTEPEKPAEAPQGAPEKYEFKAPEGYEIDQEFLDKATPVLKKYNLTNEAAQELFDVVQSKITNAQDEIYDAYDQLRTGWRKEIATDRDIGDGKDSLSPVAKQNIAAVIDAMPEGLRQPFKDAMNLTGAGDHPAFVRAWNWIGSQLREGTLVPGTKPSPMGQKAPGSGPTSAATALYPNLPSSAR